MGIRDRFGALTRNEFGEGAQIVLARARGQVIHPINLPELERGLTSRNHAKRRRSERALLRAAKRGIVRSEA